LFHYCFLLSYLIIITHGVIDLWKINKERKLNEINETIENIKNKLTGTSYFFIDQLLHLAIITLAWLYITNNFNQVFPSIVQFFTDKKSIAIITAFVINIWPVGIAIGKITEPFRKEISTEDS